MAIRAHTGRHSLPSRARVPLANSFEEHDPGRDRNVERFNGARGWKRNNEIAPLARQLMQALAFAAEDDSHWRRVVQFAVIFVPLLIEAHKPIAGILQLPHGPHEIGHLRDRQMCQRSCGSSRDGISQSRRASFGNHHAMRANCTISSTRVSCLPLAMAMRSIGRHASSASLTACMPVSLSMEKTVYR